jgi:hypothetical protein
VSGREEEGITNLGPVPEGMTFFEAICAARPDRKYKIDPEIETRRLTLCETLREIRREVSQPEPDLDKIAELAAASFDFGKRMDARMKELKKGKA